MGMHWAGVVGWGWQLWHFDAGVLAHCRCWFAAQHLATGASQGSLAAGTKVPASLRVLGRCNGLAQASCPSDLTITPRRAVRAGPAVQVEDDHVATRLTDLLDKGACGRATFMPLNRLRVGAVGWVGGMCALFGCRPAHGLAATSAVTCRTALTHAHAHKVLSPPPTPLPRSRAHVLTHPPTPRTPPLPRPRAAPQRDLPPAVWAGRHPPHQEAQV